MTRKQRVTRVVYGVYVVVVAAFVVSNIAQVGSALFGANGGGAQAAAARFPKVNEICAQVIADEVVAIDKALLAASSEPSGEAARARYASERAGRRTSDLERACGADPNGTDALAALARFDRAADSHAVRTATELSPVRLSTQSFIRGPR